MKALIGGLGVAALLTACMPGGDFVFVNGVLCDGCDPDAGAGDGSSRKAAGEACASSAECASGLWCNDVSRPPARTCESCVETAEICQGGGTLALCTTDWCQASPITECRAVVPAASCLPATCTHEAVCNNTALLHVECTETADGATCTCTQAGSLKVGTCMEPTLTCDLSGSCCGPLWKNINASGCH